MEGGGGEGNDTEVGHESSGDVLKCLNYIHSFEMKCTYEIN